MSLGEWGGPVVQPSKVSAGTVLAYEVVTVNADGTVDLRNRQSRATRQRVPRLAGWTPTAGDLVLGADIGDDVQSPAIIAIQKAAITAVSRTIGGRVASDGTASSAEFTINKTGTGVYEVHFTPAFAATPATTATVVISAQRAAEVLPGTESASGATIRTFGTSTGGVATDTAFNFIATGS